MTKKKRKRKTKKQREKEAEYGKEDVIIFEEITEEPAVEVKQPFTDPSGEVTPIVATTVDELVIKMGEITKTIGELPEAVNNPSNRWYGEEFLPEYLKTRNKLRRLAGL